MSLKYKRILQAVRSTAWAIEPQRLVDIMEVLAYKARGGEMSREDIAAYIDIQTAAKPRSERAGGVAVLGLRGIIENRIEQVDDISGPGGTSIELFRSRFRDAMNNDAVGSIVIDIDSPGGSVDGVMEMASEIRAARQKKPIVAVANTLAASAAYWLGSQASEFVAAPSASVGSIGVFAAHSDISEKLAAEGERVTLVHAGAHKIEGNPFEPLSDEARGYMQELVDSYYDDFVVDVARGRGTKPADVKANYGGGRILRADKALEAGMIDRIETFDEAVSRMRGTATSKTRAWAPTTPEEFAFL